MNTSIFFPCNNEILNKQLKFTAEIDKMTAILRHTLLINGSRRENDAEHSWHIAVMALLFEDFVAEKPNLGHAIKMLIIHDLVEIYAGDTFAFDRKANIGKKEREQEAACKLFSQIPEKQGNELRTLWEEFDNMKTVDSKYANCMDRLQPFLHNTLTSGHTWKESNANRSMVEERMNIVKEFMPEVWKWVTLNIVHGIKEGWIKEY